MLVFFAAGLVLALFCLLAEAAQRGNRRAAVALVLLAIALVVLAAIGALGGMLYYGFRCDDACDSVPPFMEWQHQIDSWQWTAQLLASLLGFATMVLALVLVVRKRFRPAAYATGATAIAFAGWAAIVAPLGNGLGI